MTYRLMVALGLILAANVASVQTNADAPLAPSPDIAFLTERGILDGVPLSAFANDGRLTRTEILFLSSRVHSYARVRVGLRDFVSPLDDVVHTLYSHYTGELEAVFGIGPSEWCYPWALYMDQVVDSGAPGRTEMLLAFEGVPRSRFLAELRRALERAEEAYEKVSTAESLPVEP